METDKKHYVKPAISELSSQLTNSPFKGGSGNEGLPNLMAMNGMFPS
jgi:hypothetical protein